MITETGTVKTAAEISTEVHKELNRTNFILSIVYTVCGAFLFIIGLVMAVMQIVMPDENESWTESYLFLVLGLILFVCGIFIIYLRSKAIKSAQKYKTVEENEFFRDYFISKQYVNGEHLVTAKVYYNRLVTFRETKNYLFLYNTRATATAVDKRTVTAEELNAIKNLISQGMAKARQNVAAPVEQTEAGEVNAVEEKPAENADSVNNGKDGSEN